MFSNDRTNGRCWNKSWWVLLAVIFFVVCVRVRLLSVPLERDEGEFAYVGQLILQGVPPFHHAYVFKLPGTYGAYALIMGIFGQTAIGIHLGLLLVNVVSIVMLFWLARNLFGSGTGLVAATSYGLLSLSPEVYGSAAHATQFVVAAMLAGCLLALRFIRGGTILLAFWSGVFFGLAFLFKQPGLIFGAFAGVALLGSFLSKRPVAKLRLVKALTLFSAGVLAPFGSVCLIMLGAGVFQKFWFWNFQCAAERWHSLSGGMSQIRFFFDLAGPNVGFWWLAGAGLLVLVLMPTTAGRKLFALGFVGACVLSTSVGFTFNPNYFVTALPAIGLLVGLAIAYTSQWLKQRNVYGWISYLPGILFAGVCVFVLTLRYDYFFRLSPEKVNAKIYFGNPFIEAVEVGNYIRTHSTEASQIAVLGSESEICFYSRRRSVTGHLSGHLIMESKRFGPALRREMIHEIEAGKPEYIVVVNNPLSWLLTTEIDFTLHEWFQDFGAEHYELVGVVEEPDDAPPVYHWDEPLVFPLKGVSDLMWTRSLFVLKRKTANLSSASSSGALDQKAALRDLLHRVIPFRDTTDLIVENNIAKALATHASAKVRDGRRAVEIAEKNCERAGSPSLLFLDTLAAAYAEAGRFTEATVTMQKVISIAESQGRSGLVPFLRNRMELYKSGKPYHEPQ